VTCPRCGRDNAEDARFCSNCGQELLAAPTPPGSPPPWHGPPRPDRRIGVGTLTSGWMQAVRLGSETFLFVALVGEALAFLVYAAAHVASADTQLGVVDTSRLGGLYFFGFHHVGISISTRGVAPGFRIHATFGFAVALLLVTGAAAWLLYRYGRRLAVELGGTMSERALHGAKLGVPYAALSLILSFVVPFDEQNGHVDVAHVSAFVIPLLLGALAGAAGGVSSLRQGLATREPWGRRAVAAVAGGAQAFVASLLLAFIGLLVVAALKPDDTRAYVHGVSHGASGAAALVHHVLALPNQSIWVVAPAMGGCDGVYGGAGPASLHLDFLCYWHFPRGRGTTDLGPSSPFVGRGVGRLPVGFGTAPPGYFAFLLVPLLSTMLGGATAARRAGSPTRTEAMLTGGLAGVVLGGLLGLAAWASTIGISASGVFDVVPLGASGTIGPRISTALLLGLAWGIGGGVAGGAIRYARHPGPSAQREEPGSESEPGSST
jgi:uncharacterized protein DUF6350/zinc ribbon protein